MNFITEVYETPSIRISYPIFREEPPCERRHVRLINDFYRQLTTDVASAAEAYGMSCRGNITVSCESGLIVEARIFLRRRDRASLSLCHRALWRNGAIAESNVTYL